MMIVANDRIMSGIKMFLPESVTNRFACRGYTANMIVSVRIYNAMIPNDVRIAWRNSVERFKKKMPMLRKKKTCSTIRSVFERSLLCKR